MSSMKQMRKEEWFKRPEGSAIEYRMIHIEPGLNPEGRTEEDDENDQELYEFILEKGVSQLPEWEVRPREDGGVWVVDGHCRHKQVGRLIAEGKTKSLIDPRDGKIWIPIKHFDGNDLDRTIRVVTSNKKKTLKPHQFAEIVKRLQTVFKLEPVEISRLLCVSRSKVDQALILSGANHDVQQAVKNQEISATMAVNLVRDHGESAGQVIEQAKDGVKKKGKTRVTAKDLPPKGPSKREMTIAVAVRDMCRDAFDIKALSAHEWKKAIDALCLEDIISGVK